ncbi:MAG: cysteine desulfurase family protein [Phycisphaerae bacterium]|jgi:cysteine desulfurase
MIYLDYNASTPVDPAVREAMLPFLGEHFGNPSSGHAFGQTVRRAVDEARAKVAGMLEAEPSEIVFTSGGTESNNHVIKGVAFALRDRGRHIITSAVEHPAVINPCRYLESQGHRVTYVPVDSTGSVDPELVIDEICPDTILISIMHANNEVGTIQPIAEIATAASRRGVLMHTDAAQSCGKIPTSVSELGVDFLSVAGHKVYAPQGIGALYVRRGVEIEPLHHGAGHESGRRAGTEAVSNIIGLGKAAELAVDSVDDAKVKSLRDRLHDGIRKAAGDDVVLLGHPEDRLPNTLALGFRGKFGADILASCPDICASTGAACHATERKRSDVLAAMNVPEDVAFGAIRFSVGRFTTEAEIDAAIRQITAAVG